MSNSLASVHPELISEWSEKNLPLTPDIKVVFIDGLEMEVEVEQ